MFEPVTYGNLAQEIVDSIASRITDRQLRVNAPRHRRLDPRVTTPLTLGRLIHLGYQKWWDETCSMKDLTDELFYPDGRAYPWERVLVYRKEELEGLRKIRRANLFVPAGENRVGLKTDRRDKYGGLLRSRRIFWLPGSQSPDMLEAGEYQNECRRLQATKAGRKAKRLLLDNLTDVQRHDYFTKGVFTVAGNGYPRRHYYVIDNSYPNGNIFQIEKGRVRGDYCFHPAEPYPMDDIVLTQKLLIETDEETFRKEANFSPRHPDDYFMPDLNGYPISTADREWSGGRSFVPHR